jgi:uncharacterized protein (TIGR02246 family)
MKTIVKFCDATDSGILVQTLYKELLEYWEEGNATSYAGLFADNANVVGFDGSQMNGKNDIETTLEQIFADHKVAPYVSIVQEVRPLNSGIYLLRATVGMIKDGAIMPERNAIQSMVAEKQLDLFVISLFHNTPAAFHGRPALVKQMTEQLTGIMND